MTYNGIISAITYLDKAVICCMNALLIVALFALYKM